MNAAELFKHYAFATGQALYTPLVTASPVKAGDFVLISKSEADCHIEGVRADGWQMKFGKLYGFVASENFQDLIRQSLDTNLSITAKDLPGGVHPIPAHRNAPLTLPDGTEVLPRDDGWYIPVNGENLYMLDIEFRANFNTNAAPLNTEQRIFRLKPQAVTRTRNFVVAPEAVDIELPTSVWSLDEGDVLYENEYDITDRYSVVSSEIFARDHTILSKYVM